MTHGSTNTAERLLESFDGRAHRMSLDYLRETFGWNSNLQGTRKRTLPYANSRELREVREIGRTIATKPTGISATSKLISFAVGRGHTYTVSARQRADRNERRLASQLKFSSRAQSVLDVELERLDWVSHQVETYERIVRDGEVFRQVWLTGAGVDLTYIEPDDVDQPQTRGQCNLLTVSDFIRDLFDGDRPPGVLGIVSAPHDVRQVLGYWVKNEEGTFDFVSSQSVQHVKDGCDKNDPRGVPRFYWGFCHVMGIDEIDGAMRDLFLVQAKHAAVYNYEQSSLISDLKRMATQQRHEEDRYDGRPAPPGIAHAKGFTIDLPGIHVAAKDAVEIIQQEQRLIGGCSDIPEHLISEDANTGNRSSLVAAEGPFDRRVQREQLMLWPHDRAVLWQILLRDPGLQIADLRETQLDYKLTPHFPAAQSRDRDKEIESEVLLHTQRLKSGRQVRETLRIDHDQAEQDIQSEPPPPQPQPQPVANKTQASGKQPAKNVTSGNPGSPSP